MNMLMKGKSFPDGTYKYICGCGFKDSNCAWCRGGDLKRCQDAIKTSRGSVYYGLLKTILSHVGKALVGEFKSIDQTQQKVAAIDIGWLAFRYGLNLKATCEYLEETGCLRTGTYERVLHNKEKLKVRDIIEAGRAKWEPSTGTNTVPASELKPKVQD